MEKLFFRCNADDKSGLGHFSRCLNIARNLISNHHYLHIEFHGNYNSFAVEQLKKYKINFTQTDAQTCWDINFNSSLANQCDCFILDTYLVNEKFISEIKNKNCKLIVVDDFMQYDFSCIDLIINFCIDAEKRFAYKNPNVALGLNYFPVRPELKKIRIDRLNNFSDKAKSVLILMGGNDHLQIGPKLIAPLLDFLPGISIHLISNIEMKTGNPRVFIHPFSSTIENFYADADLVIHGGGLAKYESAYCGIPNISIALSENIQTDTAIFCEKELCVSAGLASQYSSEILANAIQDAMTEKNRKHLAAASAIHFSTESLTNLTDLILA